MHSQRECNRLYVNEMSNITADLLIDISVKKKLLSHFKINNQLNKTNNNAYIY